MQPKQNNLKSLLNLEQLRHFNMLISQQVKTFKIQWQS